MKIIKIIVDQLPADCLMNCPLKYDRAGCGKFIVDDARGGYGDVSRTKDVFVR